LPGALAFQVEALADGADLERFACLAQEIEQLATIRLRMPIVASVAGGPGLDFFPQQISLCRAFPAN